MIAVTIKLHILAQVVPQFNHTVQLRQLFISQFLHPSEAQSLCVMKHAVGLYDVKYLNLPKLCQSTLNKSLSSTF